MRNLPPLEFARSPIWEEEPGSETPVEPAEPSTTGPGPEAAEPSTTGPEEVEPEP